MSTSAPQIFNHLLRVREATERSANLAHDIDMQAARYLLRVPFAQHPECLRSFLQLYYPFSTRLLTDHATRLDKHILAQNLLLPLDAKYFLFDEAFDLNWREVSRYYPLSLAQLKRFVNNIYWDEAALNPLIDWTENLIRNYSSRGANFFENLSANPSPYWTLAIMATFQDKWDKTRTGLLSNEGLLWHEGQVVQLIIDIIKGKVGSEPALATKKFMVARAWERQSANRHFDWTSEYLRQNKDELHWDLLSANPALPFTLELIGEFAECWDWQELATNHGLYDKVLRPWLNDTVVHELLLLTV